MIKQMPKKISDMNKLANVIRDLYIQLFRERLSEKVHATIPKGIVGGFEYTILQSHGLMCLRAAKGKQQT